MNQYMINVFKGIWRHVYMEYTSKENMVGDTEKHESKNGTFYFPSSEEDILQP